ncbi:MAG: BREX-4 system phosphatase PglZ [Bacteroidales bacterium]|nr:BREX-4 system phosphatase PglZ [Bacteroidales bacterium]
MYREPFFDMESLKAYVIKDKEAEGFGAATRDRYPIRFVLFDNFRDCYNFVDYLQMERGAHVESVDHWIDSNYPDLMITHVELAERVANHIKKKSPNDCVIAPFSELARFYDNDEKKAFDALIKTIKAIQATPKAVENHQRVYIPLVGLEGKMDSFRDDSQINIWRLITERKDLSYRLILTDENDFGVSGLESKYTVVNNIREWLNIWKDSKQQVSPHIICKSKSIFANAGYAQPDNAFNYEICHNSYEFLALGLGLAFGGIIPQQSDGNNWDLLAHEINISNGFKFTDFVKSYFGIHDIDDHKDFIRLWFSRPTIFDRWLLARFYSNKKSNKGFICRALEATTNYGTHELIENMAEDLTTVAAEIKVRKYCLEYAVSKGVRMSDSAESMVSKALQDISDKIGYHSALQYFTGIARKEKEIAISWLGQKHITIKELADFYPDLYYYANESIGLSAGVPEWVNTYFEQYKKAKLSNRYTQEMKDLIASRNESESAFDLWYNHFSTTYTLLKDRKDIEVFFWIDGLGIDWIPLIKQIIAEKKEQQIFLNEVKIARAKLPTKTDINKTDLQRLLPEGKPLEKSGDLDALAHRNDNISPFTVIKEIELVRNCVESILSKFTDKKIAIISDHGLTYLSQLVNGLNLSGVESDHHGRIAIRKKPGDSVDSSYFRMDDKVTLCALKHESLCAKLPSGQGGHGGCTPEEVLVPIFIISNSPVAISWSVQLLTPEVNGSYPRAKFEIKNLPSIEVPCAVYGGNTYSLHQVVEDIYETEDLVLDVNEQTITIKIGNDEKDMKMKVSTGIQENDLF